MFTEEKSKIGIADFCSKLGGTLNLWAGITVVVALEIVELLGRIVLFKMKPKHNGSKETKVETLADKTQITERGEKVGFPEKEDRFQHLDTGFHNPYDRESDQYRKKTNYQAWNTSIY